MKFDRVLLLVAVFLIIGGLVSILTAMPPSSNLDLENLGDRQPENLKQLCVLYEEAKKELVQLNLSMHATISGFRRTLGGSTITSGIVALMLLGVTDPKAQGLILKAFLVATLISFAFTIHLTLFVVPGSNGWIPLGIHVFFAGILFSGLNRLRKAAS
jgi:hypothetical protein